MINTLENTNEFQTDRCREPSCCDSSSCRPAILPHSSLFVHIPNSSNQDSFSVPTNTNHTITTHIRDRYGETHAQAQVQDPQAQPNAYPTAQNQECTNVPTDKSHTCQPVRYTLVDRMKHHFDNVFLFDWTFAFAVPWPGPRSTLAAATATGQYHQQCVGPWFPRGEPCVSSSAICLCVFVFRSLHSRVSFIDGMDGSVEDFSRESHCCSYIRYLA